MASMDKKNDDANPLLSVEFDFSRAMELPRTRHRYCCPCACFPNTISTLFHIDVAPEPLKAPYILSGYRLALTPKECIASIFGIHNETLNIWTHILGSVLFLWLTLWTLFVADLFVSWWDRVLMALYCLCGFVCFTSSFIYHVFCCMGVEVNNRLLRIDVGGVFLVIASSCIPPCIYGFSCMQPWGYIYASLILFTNVGSSFVLLSERFQAPEYRDLKASLMAVVAMTSIIPVAHIAIWSGLKDDIVNFHLIEIGKTYLIYGVGIFFFISRLPERMFPGWFDLVFQSHQIWHFLVCLACYSHFYTCIGIYNDFIKNPHCLPLDATV